jgi:flagellar hook-basal body complex protein FliE
MIPSLFPSSLPSPITAPSSRGASLPPPGQESGGGFAQELQGALGQMQQLDASASQQVHAVISGQSTDLHSSLIAVEKADLAFGMMLQLRNKAVAAYQQLANMQF